MIHMFRIISIFIIWPISAGWGPVPPVAVDTKYHPADPQWISRPTLVVDSIKGYAQSPDTGLCAYGGQRYSRYLATGYFRTQKVNERWWLVDPEGHLTTSRGIVAVTTGTSSAFQRALRVRYATVEVWAESTALILKDLGFNTSGAWSRNSLLQTTGNPPGYTCIWNFMSSYAQSLGSAGPGDGHDNYRGGVPPVFDSTFESFTDDYARRAFLANQDPLLLGHFTDNELPWPDNAIDLYLQLAASDQGFQAAVQWLQTRKGIKQIDVSDITATDRTDFLSFMADRYYRIVTTALRKYDPNHLVLGDRIFTTGKVSKSVLSACGRYCDIISLNYYGSWAPDTAQMNTWVDWSRRPFLISEWYAKGDDVPQLSNESGAGWLVRSQADRGRFYQHFTLGLIAQGSCVGWHWFQFLDNDPTDTTVDPSNRNSNKGIVDITYSPYLELTKAMQALNRQVYALTEYFDQSAIPRRQQDTIALSIVSPPANVSVQEGDVAFFSVMVAGFPDRLQWFVNDSAIEGATQTSLMLSNVTAAMNGALLSVRVSDGARSILSQAARLHVMTFSGPVIEKKRSPFIIDGRPDSDWFAIPPLTCSNTVAGDRETPQDIAATFRLAWDEQMLYLLAQITDDTLSNPLAESFFRDGIKLIIDPNNAKAAHYDSTVFRCRFDRHDMAGNIAVKFGALFAESDNSNGYCMEMAIPWRIFHLTPAVGAFIGFDLEVTDMDGSSAVTRIAWAAKQDITYQTPSVLGTLRLGGIENSIRPFQNDISQSRFAAWVNRGVLHCLYPRAPADKNILLTLYSNAGEKIWSRMVPDGLNRNGEVVENISRFCQASGVYILSVRLGNRPTTQAVMVVH
jgi:hypothetical protein